MVRQSRRWSTEGLTRPSTSYKHCRKRSVRLRECWLTPKPCEWPLRIDKPTARPQPVIFACRIWPGTPTVINATSQGSTGAQPTAPATLSCGWPRPRSCRSPSTVSHLIMQAVSKVEGKVSCIPNNTTTQKVHLILPGVAALYWQRSVSASISWQAGGGQ